MKSKCFALSCSFVAVLAASNLFAAEPADRIRNYQYDANGNITSIGSDVFAYDGVDRVTSGTVNGRGRTYTYDAFGNRRKCTDVASNSDCQYGAVIATSTNRIVGAAYDDRGALIQYAGQTYDYDEAGMLKRGPGTVEYVYTADDERIAVVTPTNWTWTLRDASGKVLREMKSTPAAGGAHAFEWSRDYVFRNGVLLSSADATSGTRHYHTDHLGTPRIVSDPTGAVVGVHDYFPFGLEVGENLAEPNAARLRFTGHERDLSGLDYMHARYYGSQWGRFLSIDPVMEPDEYLSAPQRWNRYAYAANNPLTFVDPDGKRTRVFIVSSGSDLFSMQGHAALYVETPNGNAGVSLGTTVDFSHGVEGFVKEYNAEGRTVTAYDMDFSADQEEAIRNFLNTNPSAGTDSSKNLQARLMLAENCAAGVCNALAAGGLGSSDPDKRAANFFFGTERPFTLQDNLEQGPLSNDVKNRIIYAPGKAPTPPTAVPGMPPRIELPECGHCSIQ